MLELALDVQYFALGVDFCITGSAQNNFKSLNITFLTKNVWLYYKCNITLKINGHITEICLGVNKESNILY